jgi:putative transposase
LIAATTLSVREAFSTTKEAYAFEEFGLLKAIRTDNGVPFASPK